MKHEKLTEEEEQLVIKQLQKESRFVWKSKLNWNYTIMMLNNIREGNIELSEMLPGGVLTYKQYLEERLLINFVI